MPGVTVGRTVMSADRPRVAFVLEEALGHATHAQNLMRLIAPDERIRPAFAPIAFEPHPQVGEGSRPRELDGTRRHPSPPRRPTAPCRGPGRCDVRPHPGAGDPHARPTRPHADDRVARCHPGAVRRVGRRATDTPSATRDIERLKRRLQRAGFDRTAALVTWSEWAKSGLVDHYGVEPDKVTVIPPGVDRERWETQLDDVTTVRRPPGTSAVRRR